MSVEFRSSEKVMDVKTKRLGIVLRPAPIGCVMVRWDGDEHATRVPAAQLAEVKRG